MSLRYGTANQTYVLEFSPLHFLEEHSFYSLAGLVSILRPVLHSTRTLRFFPHLIQNCLLHGFSSYVFAFELPLGHPSPQEQKRTVDWLVLEGLTWCFDSVLDRYINHWFKVMQVGKLTVQCSLNPEHWTQCTLPSIIGALLSSVTCLFSPLPEPILRTWGKLW